MMRGDANHFSPLVFTFRMSVPPVLARVETPSGTKYRAVRPRAVLSPALLSCYRVSAQEIQLYNTWCRNAVILY